MVTGPLMVDITGFNLTAEEFELLQSPVIGGVILFARNYENPVQLKKLTAEIRSIRPLLITIDQEGGRVQRLRAPFVKLPAMEQLGTLYDRDPKQACELTEQVGKLLAVELRAVDIDLSFTPVLDLGRGISTVIGDRAFHAEPAVIVNLAQALVNGMRQAGMAAVGKHFPGHGSVVADSHVAVPIDSRPWSELEVDLFPFQQMIAQGLPALMMAHVIYPAIDAQPAGFSKTWILEVLRQQLSFQGAVFSDDLSMAGAAIVGDPVTRALRALEAGCDCLLVCHDRMGVYQLVRELADFPFPEIAKTRLNALYGQQIWEWEALRTQAKQLNSLLTECLDGYKPYPAILE